MDVQLHRNFSNRFFGVFYSDTKSTNRSKFPKRIQKTFT